MDGIPYAVRAVNGKHAVSPGAICCSVTARMMPDTAPVSAGLPVVAIPARTALIKDAAGWRSEGTGTPVVFVGGAPTDDLHALTD